MHPTSAAADENPDRANIYAIYFLYFSIVASIQGRVAYCLMSIHAVHPTLVPTIFGFDTTSLLFSNMVYGTFFMLYTRPTLFIFDIPDRLIISSIWSMMFNHSVMSFYGWLLGRFSNWPILITILSFFSSRFFLYYMLMFLYNTDALVFTLFFRGPR